MSQLESQSGDSQGESVGSQLNDDELNQLEQSSKPAATVKATASGMRKFNQWMERRGRQCDWANVNAGELNEILRKYYAEVKHAKPGSSLTPSSLTGLRAAIHRHVTSAPYSRPLNIIKDKEFTSANAMFTARCKLYMKQGNKKPQHKPCIGDGDMAKLGTYFTQWNAHPDIALAACWFHLCFFFGRRGREGWASMTKDTFQVQQDTEGHKYVAMNQTETTKNHQGGHRQKDADYSDQRMYGPGVDILVFYKSKLNPSCQRLFQKPLVAYTLDGYWYKNEPIGKNTLASMMQAISKKAGLSTVYTCHSVRASTITTLFRAGVSTQSIVAITKHKNTTSLGHYISDLSTGQKRECSGVLSSALSVPSSTFTVLTNN